MEKTAEGGLVQESSESSLSRRGFFVVGGISLLALGAVVYSKRTEIANGIENTWNSAIDVIPFNPEHPKELEIPSLYDLDYLERLSPSPRQPFLDYKSGHRKYLRSVVMNSPGIRRNIGISLNKMLYAKEAPTLSNLFEQHILLAKEVLDQSEPGFSELRPEIQFYQALSMGTYSLTAILGAWIKMAEFRAMGVNFPDEYSYVDRFGISPTYQLWRCFPRIFPVLLDAGIDKDSYAGLFFGSGTDRSVHLMNHFFLVSRYMALSYSKNQDAQRVPKFVKPILIPFNNSEKGIVLSRLAGLGWEVKETLKDKDVVGNFEKQPGFYDPVVSLDLEANKTGADLAIDVFSGIFDGKGKSFSEHLSYLKKKFEKLEQPYYSQPQKLLRRLPFLNWYYTVDI